MAYAAQLGALTAELIEAIAASPPAPRDPDHFNLVKETSLRQLRHHSYLRTNQFEVYKQLDGLEERLRILNRDGLADALHSSLAGLAKHDLKWAPDVLYFLLELSDKPVEKSKLADLDLLKEPDTPPEPVLTWDEIAKEDGWAEDRHLWKDVNFAGDSSDEELGAADDASETHSEKLHGSEDTTISSSDEPRLNRSPSDLVVEIQDVSGLESVFKSQSWRLPPADNNPGSSRPQTTDISETQAVREVLFLLRGLDSSLFDHRGSSVVNFKLIHASTDVFQEALSEFGRIGRQLSLLRVFAKQKQPTPLIQVFQSAIEERLHAFDTTTTRLEQRLVNVEDNVVVSLSRILHDLHADLGLMSSLSDLVQDFLQSRYPHPFRYLELLFDAATDAQLEGKHLLYEYLATIFLECFRIYLQPIRLWMESGELIDNDKIFFVSSGPVRLPSHQVWKDQYKLRVTQDGTLLVPRFLHPSIANIFTAGKSIVMLKLLGRNYSFDRNSEPPLDFATISAGNDTNFIPFSEVFNSAFNRWMQTKHHAAYATLRQVLLRNCGLLSEVNALHAVYLMTNGARSGVLTTSISHNLDLLNPNWHDRLALTQVSHDAFESVIDSRRLVVSVPSNEVVGDVVIIRTSVRLGLPLISVNYHLSWPLRIVISDESLAQYQAVFTLLLQLRRAIYVLQKHKPLMDGVADLTQDQTAYYRIRMRLLWFCNVLDTYFTTLVIGPLTAQLHIDLDQAQDIDAMIGVHSSFAKRMVDEVCLGTRLDPIKQCILDVLDMAIKLEDSRQAEAQREADATQELSRLSLPPSSPQKERRQQQYMQPSEEEDQTFLEEEQDKSIFPDDEDPKKDYFEVLCDMASELDRHMKFLCSGLRGVARASSNPAAAKWDTLAEMLEFGVQEHKPVMA